MTTSIAVSLAASFLLKQRLKNRTRSVESQLSGFIFLRSYLSVRFYAVYPDVPETVKLILFSPQNERQLRGYNII